MRLFTILLALVQKVGAINNYITEQGTDVSWTYRKWNNGKAEAWGIINMPSPITPYQSGEMFMADINGVNFPAGLFSTVPDHIWTSYQPAEGTASQNYGGSTTQWGTTTASKTCNVSIMRATSVNFQGKINIYAVGKWK